MGSLRSGTALVLKGLLVRSRRVWMQVTIGCVLALCCAWAGGQTRSAVIRFGAIEPPVVAQADITVDAAVSTQEAIKKPLECSGLAWADGKIWISSDRHGHVLFVCDVDLDTMTIELPKAVAVIPNEQLLLDDAEAMTLRQGASRRYGYVMCSMSNDSDALPLPKRRHMLRYVLPVGADKPISPVVINLTPLRGKLQDRLDAAGIDPYVTWNIETSSNTYRWANTEAIAFVPGANPPTLLCGMRNPLSAGRAIFYTISGVDQAFNQRQSSRIEVTDMFTLDLGRRGASDICWDPLTQGYLIVAAKSNGPKLDADQPFPPNTLDSALFWWSGRKDESPVHIADAPDMKLEAITRLGDSPYIAVASDEGDVSESRPGRQSLLTIMEFTGLNTP